MPSIVERLRTEPSVIVANYAGWGPGQLEREIAEGSWSSLPATIAHVFESDVSGLWDQVTGEAAQVVSLSEILRLRQIPPDPSLN